MSERKEREWWEIKSDMFKLQYQLRVTDSVIECLERDIHNRKEKGLSYLDLLSKLLAVVETKSSIVKSMIEGKPLKLSDESCLIIRGYEPGFEPDGIN